MGKNKVESRRVIPFARIPSCHYEFCVVTLNTLTMALDMLEGIIGWYLGDFTAPPYDAPVEWGVFGLCWRSASDHATAAYLASWDKSFLLCEIMKIHKTWELERKYFWKFHCLSPDMLIRDDVFIFCVNGMLKNNIYHI